jgi:hypothetical protein
LIRTGTWEEAKPRRRENNKATFRGFVTDLIVPATEDKPRPQAFLVEQEANWVLPVHFHLRHQFQVITAGGGVLGKRPVEPLCIHYASPESGYGPLTAGPEGLSYLTLRVVSDEGAWYLPESRARMQLGIKKQQEHGEPKTVLSDAEIRELREPTVEVLIARQESGLAAHLVRMPPDQTFWAASGELKGDRFYVVTKGSLALGEANLAGLAAIFVSHDDTLELRSGPAGLEAVVLQFPEEARLEAG